MKDDMKNEIQRLVGALILSGGVDPTSVVNDFVDALEKKIDEKFSDHSDGIFYFHSNE